MHYFNTNTFKEVVINCVHFYNTKVEENAVYFLSICPLLSGSKINILVRTNDDLTMHLHGLNCCKLSVFYNSA